MALSGTLQLTSDYVPGYGVSDSRSFSSSAIPRRTLAVLPCSSSQVHRLRMEIRHLKSAANKTSFVCRASSGGHRRYNPDFTNNNNRHGFRGNNRRNEDRYGLVDGGGLDDNDTLSSENGSLSKSPKYQATSSPGPREKEIVELFRKVQAQLRAQIAAKKEGKKTEEASKGGTETVDSLLKLLRKHSGNETKKKVSSFNSEKQLQYDSDDDDDDDDDDDVVVERQDHSSNRYDSRNKDHNATFFTRPASSFRRNSPIPRHKSQSNDSSVGNYFGEADFDEASSYSVTWTQKKNQVDSRDEPEYDESEREREREREPESEPEPEPEPQYELEPELESEPGLAATLALDELSDDVDESVNDEEETAKDEEDLSALKLIELKAIAKSRGLKGVSKMKKAELVDLLGK